MVIEDKGYKHHFTDIVNSVSQHILTGVRSVTFQYHRYFLNLTQLLSCVIYPSFSLMKRLLLAERERERGGGMHRGSSWWWCLERDLSDKKQKIVRVFRKREGGMREACVAGWHRETRAEQKNLSFCHCEIWIVQLCAYEVFWKQVSKHFGSSTFTWKTLTLPKETYHSSYLSSCMKVSTWWQT